MEIRIAENVDYCVNTKELSGDKFFEIHFKSGNAICLQLENSEIDELLTNLDELREM